MKHLVKKKKNILLGILFIAIIVCTPFLFGEEGCDDGLNKVANSVDENKQNNTSAGSSNDSYGLTNEESESLLNLQTNHKLPEKHIRNTVTQLLQYENNKNPNMRSAEKTISSMSSTSYSYKRDIPNARGQFEEESIPIYLFNFKNQETDSAGFALVSGDDRLPSILIYMENGHLEKGKDIDNPGLYLLISITPEYIKETIRKVDSTRNVHLPIAIEKINAQSPDSLKIILPNAVSKNGRTNTCDPDYIYVYTDPNSYSSNATYGASMGSLIPLRWSQ